MITDEDIINSYIPEPHPDGTPIQPEELPNSLPAYMINVKPELRIDGTVVATGSPITMGTNETFTMTFSGPTANDRDIITNEVKAGNYLGIAIDPSRISQEQMESLKTKLETTKAKLEAEDFTGMTKDDILGDLLYTTALSYLAEYGVMNDISAKTMGVVAITYPSETIFSHELKSNYAFGFPISVSSNGLAMDADRLMHLTKALDGNTEKPKQFMMTSGMNGSVLEHSVPEQLFSTPENPAEGISAVKALQIASSQEIPVYTINQSNIDTVLPQLQLDAGTIADIRNAVNTGKVVTTSKTEITHHDWTGCGYIIIDPTTGDGAYMISKSISGGWLFLGNLKLLIINLFLLPSGRGFDEVMQASTGLLEEWRIFWPRYKELLQFEFDYLVCVKDKLFFGNNDNTNIIGITGIVADIAAALQLLSSGSAPLLATAGAWGMYIIGLVAITGLLFSIGWSCRDT